MPLLWFLRLSRARTGWRTRLFIWQLRTPILCLSSPVRSARTKPRRRTVECRRARPTCFPIAHCCCGASDPPRHNNQRKKSQNKMGNGSGRKCCSKRGMRWLSLPQPGKNTFSTRSQSALEQTSDASKQPQKEVKIPSLQLDNRKLTTDLVAGSRIVSTRPLSSRKSFQGFRPFLSNSLPTFFLFCPWLGSPILLRLHTQKPLDPDSFCASVSRLAPLS